MPKDSLTKFANVLYNEALKEKEKVAKELDAKMKQTLAGADAMLEKDFQQKLKGHKARVEYEIRLALSHREAELEKALRQNRAKTADEVFGEVAKRLSEFAKSNDYEKYLAAEFESVASEFSRGTTVCASRECDKEMILRLSPIENMEIKAAEEEIIGGFTLRNEECRVFADCTLLSKLEEQKEEFFKMSGLTIN